MKVQLTKTLHLDERLTRMPEVPHGAEELQGEAAEFRTPAVTVEEHTVLDTVQFSPLRPPEGKELTEAEQKRNEQDRDLTWVTLPTGDRFGLRPDEFRTVSSCPDCSGLGYTGVNDDHQPIVCAHCNGFKVVPFN